MSASLPIIRGSLCFKKALEREFTRQAEPLLLQAITWYKKNVQSPHVFCIPIPLLLLLPDDAYISLVTPALVVV